MTAQALGESVKAAAQSVNPLAWLTPRNLGLIRQELDSALAHGDDSISSWRYDDFDSALSFDRIADARLELKRSECAPEVARLVERTLDRFEDARTSISMRRDSILNEWNERAYGSASSGDLRRAEAQFEAPVPVVATEPAYSSAEVAGIIKVALKSLGLNQWTVSLVENAAARMSVRPLSRTVRVLAETTFSGSQLNRLLVHEVGSHVLRAANSQNQPEPLAAVSLGEPQPTEEGLAVWAEVRAGVSDPDIMRVYAARAIATRLANSAGIVDVVRGLEKFVGHSTAISIAIRAKRGLRDPNQPGGLSKDHAYWTGYIAVDEYLSRAPADYCLLMATKWPLEELNLVRDMVRDARLIKASLLPHQIELPVVER